jgi:hypothetical protein
MWFPESGPFSTISGNPFQKLKSWLYVINSLDQHIPNQKGF